MLEITHMDVAYGAIKALQGVSLRVQPGEIVTIVGANGAGKSSLLNAIAGLVPLRAGSLLFDGRDITHEPAHRRTRLGLALSPEGRGVFADQTVRDNLVLGAFCRHDKPAVLQQRMEFCFEIFPLLKQRADQLSGTLSGGEQQMLAIARALMSQPRLLLLDEPSLGLAPLIIQDIFRVIQRLRDDGLTILLVEQMANLALGLADRAYVLETGRMTIEGRCSDLRHDPRIQAAYLGTGASRA